MAEIVVTGASGFIGSHISDFLELRGFDVLRVSRSPGSKIYRVDSYLDTPEGKMLIHLAESPLILDAGQNADYDIYTQTFSELAARSESVIYFSSGAVYGDGNTESNSPDEDVAPRDAYSRSKLENERTALLHDGVVLRLANIFGPGMSDKNVLSDILRQIPGNGPLMIRNDNPVRDFLYINELCELIPAVIKKFKSGIYNAGSATGISIGNLARLILELTDNSNREIVATNAGQESSTTILDISETTRQFGWAPSETLEKQLESFVDTQYE